MAQSEAGLNLTNIYRAIENNLHLQDALGQLFRIFGRYYNAKMFYMQ